MTLARCTFVLGVLLLPTGAAGQSTIRGIIVDADNGRPVPAVFVELVNGITRVAGTLTDSAGAFSLRTTERGDALLVISRIGYEGKREPVRIARGDVILLPIGLQARPIAIDPIVASALETGVLEERLKGYYHRKQLGAGYFISTERLKNAAGAPLSDVLRSVPGISVSGDRSTPFGPVIMTNSNLAKTQTSPFQRRGRTPNSQLSVGPCPMQLYIDGKQFSTQDSGVDVIRPVDLIAVEVFRSLAEIPAEFGGIHARCGVISIWTRRVPGFEVR